MLFITCNIYKITLYLYVPGLFDVVTMATVLWSCWLDPDWLSTMDQARHLEGVDKIHIRRSSLDFRWSPLWSSLKHRLAAVTPQRGTVMSGVAPEERWRSGGWGVRVWRSAGWRWSDGGTPGVSQLREKQHADRLIVSARSLTCSPVLCQYSRLEF